MESLEHNCGDIFLDISATTVAFFSKDGKMQMYNSVLLSMYICIYTKQDAIIDHFHKWQLFLISILLPVFKFAWLASSLSKKFKRIF